ncbi:cyclopropane-fatty-acyl-phospholipid synthase family protein [Candidatus Chloroploca sp. Khr17]|uniref:SAM-dependent methyltransferase n=1 Tax=Candidatus Chloroploca sp. Khr17 TaxID=2496869 RepID=UPI00101BDAFB|nr:class I SAM-dependent methyltransferase [Candidatus Chloroploca sp. Khr17]
MSTSLEHDVFWKIHRDLPREAPGSDEATLQALAMLPDLPTNARILDVGCGPGTQTLALARATQAHITAVDTYQLFLDELACRAAVAGVAERIVPVQASMFELPFQEPFELIWSEGAIYIIGFAEGLTAWRRHLKPGGSIVVSELAWLQTDPPAEARQFWQEAYPGMATLDANLDCLEAAGYRSLGHFVLPEEAWWTNYYHPMAARIALLRTQYHDNPEAQRILDLEQAEIELYRRYASSYGYVFYLMQAA